ncbi:MAG: hypothetical protein WCH44_03620 [Betaproteobacteria bacterium]
MAGAFFVVSPARRIADLDANFLGGKSVILDAYLNLLLGERAGPGKCQQCQKIAALITTGRHR